MMYFGIVEDTQDPKRLGRVRVRVFGVHNKNKVDVPTDSLPWASVLLPTTSAANSGIGTTPYILNGSLVALQFLDGADLQTPLVMGTVPSEIQEVLMNIEGTMSKEGLMMLVSKTPQNVIRKKKCMVKMTSTVWRKKKHLKNIRHF